MDVLIAAIAAMEARYPEADLNTPDAERARYQAWAEYQLTTLDEYAYATGQWSGMSAAYWTVAADHPDTLHDLLGSIEDGHVTDTASKLLALVDA